MTDPVVQTIDAEITSLTERLRALQKARAALAAPKQQARTTAPKRRRRKHVTAEEAMQVATNALVQDLNGLASVAAIRAKSGLPARAVGQAMTKLEEQGRVKRTGTAQNRSPVYEVVGAGALQES